MLSMQVFLLIAQFLSKKAANANSQELDATISQKKLYKTSSSKNRGLSKVEIYPKTFLSFVNEN